MPNPLRSLQGKFILYLSFLIIGIMSCLAYWSISREKTLMENTLIREGEALVETLAISCTNTMLYEEIGLIEEGGLLDNYLSDLMHRKDLPILYAMILDPKGKVISHNSMREVGSIYRDDMTQRTLESWETLRQYPSPMVLDLSTPLAISTKRWGTLRIGLSLENLRGRVSKLILNYILYTAVLVLLSIAVIAFLFSFITKPIQSLSKSMDAATVDSDLPAFDLSRQDEIGILQRSFYRMLKRIKDDERERKRTQRNLLLTEKMVAIGKLTAGVAHEINNPLGGILNCIYHFKKGISSVVKQREYLDLMEDGVNRIQKTVKNLLEYARSPNLERSGSPTDIASLIEKPLSLLDYQIRGNQIEIRREIPQGLPPVVADKSQMGQVFVNIFLNAIQAMEGGGILKIKAEPLRDQILLAVSDTGKGIPKNALPRIFDPFFTTKGEGKGTGLGLWISQGIVERHGGTMQIESEEGKGTTVRIYFPVHQV